MISPFPHIFYSDLLNFSDQWSFLSFISDGTDRSRIVNLFCVACFLTVVFDFSHGFNHYSLKILHQFVKISKLNINSKNGNINRDYGQRLNLFKKTYRPQTGHFSTDNIKIVHSFFTSTKLSTSKAKQELLIR